MTLDERQAYEAMCHFLQQYWEAFNQATLADVLGDLNTELWAGRTPADPAMWTDWLKAISAVLDR